MGVFGAGNTASDGSMDLMADRSEQRLAAWMKLAKVKESREGDEGQYWELWLEFEELAALYERDLLTWGFPPADEIRELKEDYLKDWDAYFPQLAIQESFIQERRDVIEASFNSLIEWSEKHWERYGHVLGGG